MQGDWKKDPDSKCGAALKCPITRSNVPTYCKDVLLFTHCLHVSSKRIKNIKVPKDGDFNIPEPTQKETGICPESKI
ncbi:hypothetical protein BgiBS90_035525, partial [Biomphalaria glabrata]